MARGQGRRGWQREWGEVIVTKELTDGERRVFQAYVEQETHELAAKHLGISTQTLKNHLGNIYKKVGARKAHSALYKLALSRGMDPLTPNPTTSAGEITSRYRQTEVNGANLLAQTPTHATDPSTVTSTLEQREPEMHPILEGERE